MLNMLKQCTSWLDWRFVAGGLAVLIGLFVCGQLPTLSIFAGVTPILLILACLLPCLIPLAWLRGMRTPSKAQPAENDPHEM